MNAQDIVNEGLFESIEDVLTHTHAKQRPAKEQIECIRFRYLSPVFFLESNEYMLKQAGLNNSEAFYFWMIPGLARYASQESFGEKPKLNTLSRVAEYLKCLFIGVHVECFYALLLDGRGQLIRKVMVGQGTVDTAPFDLSKTLSLVLQYNAKALVLCHNHPGGTMQPSTEDVQCTLEALAATAAINVPLLDHIIIAKNRVVSIRDSGYIVAELWTNQGANKKIVREWLDVDLLQ